MGSDMYYWTRAENERMGSELVAIRPDLDRLLALHGWERVPGTELYRHGTERLSLAGALRAVADEWEAKPVTNMSDLLLQPEPSTERPREDEDEMPAYPNRYEGGEPEHPVPILD